MNPNNLNPAQRTAYQLIVGLTARLSAMHAERVMRRYDDALDRRIDEATFRRAGMIEICEVLTTYPWDGPEVVIPDIDEQTGTVARHLKDSGFFLQALPASDHDSIADLKAMGERAAQHIGREVTITVSEPDGHGTVRMTMEVDGFEE